MAGCLLRPACAALAGDCCPNALGVLLDCCVAPLGPPPPPRLPLPPCLPPEQWPPPPPPPRPPALQALCAAHPGCSGLLGMCCPALDGSRLACCTSPSPPSPPPPFPLPPRPQLPMPSPPLVASPPSAPGSNSSSCSANAKCVGYSGSCCPHLNGSWHACCVQPSAPAAEDELVFFLLGGIIVAVMFLLLLLCVYGHMGQIRWYRPKETASRELPPPPELAIPPQSEEEGSRYVVATGIPLDESDHSEEPEEAHVLPTYASVYVHEAFEARKKEQQSSTASC
ncbi:hypothetical protein AB1Y20_004766 [Prymnesium parvum]|uniref:Uncharacterized protein n=1 Tax=Prymnesium parvum TaxID=97485 RepID=A0AB34IZQ3_PRYPA